MGRTARDIALLQYKEETLKKIFKVMHKVYLTEEGRLARKIRIVKEDEEVDPKYDINKKSWSYHLRGLFLSIIETELEDGI